MGDTEYYSTLVAVMKAKYLSDFIPDGAIESADVSATTLDGGTL